MKIATFNANSLRARLDIVLGWLNEHQPDALCIQETKVPDPMFPLTEIEKAGYFAVFRGEKSYNGVAILSRVRPKNVAFGFDDGGPPDETRLVLAKIGPVNILNTYVPQGREIDHEMYRYKLKWFKRLRSWFDRHFKPDSVLLWTGDLNIAPGPDDVHDPGSHTDHVCCHEDVRKEFRAVVNWGFVDVFRKHHPEPGQFTFFDYRVRGAVERGMGWRVDHMLATRRLAAKSTDCRIDLKPRLAEKPSDHTFLVADFDA
jgi:exodeoxyribonuclease-3